jgi:hypothetical protein
MTEHQIVAIIATILELSKGDEPILMNQIAIRYRAYLEIAKKQVPPIVPSSGTVV